MFQTFRNAWKIDDLRKKIIFTFIVLLIFRLGAAIPVPFIDADALAASSINSEGTIFEFFNLMTGGAFSMATLFALSVQPYINASIIVNLLQVVIPTLERWSKEGEEGRKKISKVTRYSSIGLAVLLAITYYVFLRNQGAISYTTGFEGFFAGFVIVITLSAGACLLMWLGEQIDAKGIGNGISLLIFTGIIASLTTAMAQFAQYFQMALGTYQPFPGVTLEAEPWYFAVLPLVLLLFGASFVMIIIMHNAERRIPVQYAKRVVGRKMYGGNNSHIPIKVNMTGVIPVIFASAILSVPATIRDLFQLNEGMLGAFLGWFAPDNWGYAILYAVLIILFNYFYVSVQYNPVQMANDMRKNSGGIPGIRPGEPTSNFIAKVISKITLIGAFFLVLVATLPIVITQVTGINIALGGTSVLIIVGVALEINNTLESYMLMRHHKGFLE